MANHRGEVVVIWRKELRTVRPYLLLVVFLGITDFIYSLLTEYPNQLTIAQKLHGHFQNPYMCSLLYLVLSFSLASVLLMREYDDGTLEFLDSLPFSRGQAFIAKYTVAVSVIAIFPVLELASYIPLHALGRESVDPSWHLNIVAGVLFCNLSSIAIFCALAFLLAYLRRFAWLLMGVLFWVYQLVSQRIPAIERLNPLDLVDFEIMGTSLLIPWHQLGPQFLVAAAALFTSYALFSGQFTINKGARTRACVPFRRAFCRGADKQVWQGSATVTIESI